MSNATTRTPFAAHLSASKANTAPEHPPPLKHNNVGIGASWARSACWYSTMGRPAAEAEMIRACTSIGWFRSAA
jgi:hypothetical protein